MQPGHNAGFAIWVWSTLGTSKAVSVRIRIAHVSHVGAPHFTVCPRSGSATCPLGTLPTGQADELQAAVPVQRAATNGEQIQLTATASGTHAHSFTASGSMVVTRAKHKSAGTTSPPPTITLPPVSLPPAAGVGTGTGTGLGDPAGLFPTISPAPGLTPSPSPSSGLGFPPAKKQVARAATASAILPIDPRLIGGQLAGLAVLAGAIAIAIARLSLRKPRPQDGPGSQDSAK